MSCKTKPFYFALISALLIAFLSRGQQMTKIPEVNTVSPTATAIAKYIDFPVNLHTGVPEISIPIYTVQEGPLSLPISLSYHASGLPVMEVASWVGAGWSLNAGGTISRTVRGGLPDEKRNYGPSTFWESNGFSNYYLQPDDIATEGIFDYGEFNNGNKDSEPDLFTYSFGNYSGKFYFREDHKAVLIPEGDIKIDPIFNPANNSYNYLEGFIATDPEGVRYYFGVTPTVGDIDAIEKSGVMSTSDAGSLPGFISTWYLYKIESADQMFSINLSYRSESYAYFSIAPAPPCIWALDNCASTAPIKIKISGIALDRIIFTNGYVEFIAANLRSDVGGFSSSGQDDPNYEAKSLDAIKISTSNENRCRRFNFSYDYFVNNSTNPIPYVLQNPPFIYTADKKRLKLNSIKQVSCDGNETEPAYQFQYYDESTVPRRMCLGQDHWGFYNGVEDNESMIPAYSTDGGLHFYDGDNREAKWPEMRAGALHIIQYPTGGETEYVYEPNTVMTTNGCTYSSTSTLKYNTFAGMGTGSEGYGTITVNVSTTTAFYYVLSSISNGWGGLYLDNIRIEDIQAGESKSDYIVLSPGNHTIKAYAAADDDSGRGVSLNIYAANTVCDPPQEKIVGGLRIKQINKSETAGSSKLSMNYQYENSILYSIPDYVGKVRNEILKTNIIPHPTEVGCSLNPGADIYVSASSVHPLRSVQGYHIGYGKVTETFPDGGYTIYEFNGSQELPGGWYRLEDVCVRSVNASSCTTRDPIYPAPPAPYEFERGHLKSKRVYDKNDHLVKETTYTEEYENIPVGAFGMIVKNYRYAVGQDGVGGILTFYELKSARQKWTKEIEKTYGSEGTNCVEKETTTYFDSDYHNMPSKKTESSQRGLSESDYRYVPDVTQCNYECSECAADFLSSAAALRSEYNTKDENCKINICSPSSFKGVNSPDPCSWYECRQSAYIDFQFRMNEARVEYTNCLLQCKAENDCLTDGLTNTNSGVRALYQMEANNQLNVIEGTLWRDDILQNSTYYDYQPDVTGSRRIYLKNVYSTEVSSPVSTFNPVSVSGDVVQKETKYNNQPVSTFLFNQGQPVEIKERNGNMTSYIWGYNNTLPVAEIKNGMPVDCFYTSFEEDGDIFKDASGASLAKTGKKVENGSSFTFPDTFTPDESNTLMSYWYWSDDSWHFSELQPFQRTINISGSKIDEVRAFPGKAQMKTFTYDPIVGITSITDENNITQYFEYDPLGRLKQVKDQDRNIIKTYAYHYKE